MSGLRQHTRPSGALSTPYCQVKVVLLNVFVLQVYLDESDETVAKNLSYLSEPEIDETKKKEKIID